MACRAIAISSEVVSLTDAAYMVVRYSPRTSRSQEVYCFRAVINYEQHTVTPWDELR